jgi:hypothetical protein
MHCLGAISAALPAQRGRDKCGRVIFDRVGWLFLSGSDLMPSYLCYLNRLVCDGWCCGVNPDGSAVRADGSGRREYEMRLRIREEVRRIVYPDGVIVEGPPAP